MCNCSCAKVDFKIVVWFASFAKIWFLATSLNGTSATRVSKRRLSSPTGALIFGDNVHCTHCTLYKKARYSVKQLCKSWFSKCSLISKSQSRFCNSCLKATLVHCPTGANLWGQCTRQDNLSPMPLCQSIHGKYQSPFLFSEYKSPWIRAVLCAVV